jgi:hypothetical protein
VVPVFKSEDPTEFSNYRPISVLPVLSQVFEKVLQGRLLEFLDHQGMVIPGQYGFRSGHSTAMAVLDMVERVREAWRKKNVALGVFIDFKKTFDTVDHRILLAKLERYEVRGVALGLLGSYLRDRFQYVVYNGGQSGRRGVECGVPQGSVLGPLFFLFYVNDMAGNTGELDFVLFADNTNLFAEGHDPVGLFERVNGGLAELGRWFRCNRLTLNLKKTEYIYFATRPPEVTAGGLVINGEQVRRVEGSKFLGVWVDAELKWRCYIDQLGGRCGGSWGC